MSAVPLIFFKIANLTFGTLALGAAISQFTYITSNFNAFLLAIYGVVFCIPIIYLEFKVPPNLYRFASNYFSFLGRGLTYILIGFLINFGGIFKILITLTAVMLGLVYILFQFLPQVEEPQNFRGEGSPIAVDGDYDDVI
ncbi:hypothetical protein HG535_0G04610 [Zygotorulaspora mrakii]|uniref:Golgi apparatus membrane protein TVP15 n=1 Tax=Zygotorulaspora mrakii TaxID=42260 RepID=A0A7H9B771_ZYGMR|nr:uncharacterized protein HG535_0G04610 [Zygotorulaspora mrakii]QLG74578.1 hypothetical protein HG535_0G04610 [Zygotorulaspora mrakii]